MNRGRQLGRRDPRVQLLWEAEVGVAHGVVGARRRASSVQLPVEQRERDVVRHPDDGSGLEEVACRVRLCATVDEIVDQQHRRPERAEDEDRDEDDGECPELPRTAVDPAGIASDQSYQQQAFDQREQPPWARTIGRQGAGS